MNSKHSHSQLFWKTKSSHPNVFYRIGVLQNFTKLTGKNCAGVFFLMKRCFSVRCPLGRCLSVNFSNFLRTSIFCRTAVKRFSKGARSWHFGLFQGTVCTWTHFWYHSIQKGGSSWNFKTFKMLSFCNASWRLLLTEWCSCKAF